MPNENAGLSRPPSSAHSDDFPDLATVPPRSSTPSRITRQFSSGPLENGQIINARYHVIRLLGKGGMGAVYHAWDEELGVGVALKVILPTVEADPLALEDIERRFKKELILARQITHRNVVRIHDIGECDGIKFISMPYIKGHDLATILKSGALPTARVLALARQILEGLAAAHEAGVVHRDLKPANIMIDEGEHALLMDFGIARSVSTSTKATLSGTVVGTIDYMAPEQARGEQVDARADIYAVGLILLEMLNGRRQLTGDGAVADLMSRMTAAPASVRTTRPEIPEPVAALITKCLQPSAAERFQSCKEVLAALEVLDSEGHGIVTAQPHPVTSKLVIAAAAVIVSVAGISYWAAGRNAPPPPAAANRPPVSVLVADFENHTGDPVFDGTLAQSLGLAMEGASFVSAFPRADAIRAARQIKPDAPLNAEVARLVAVREGIAVILAGSIGPDGGDYILRVRALAGSTGKELSTANVSASSKEDVLPAVSRLAGSVRRALGDATPESEQVGAAETFTSGSLEAVHAYAMAQEHFWAGRQQQALDEYHRAIGLDPALGRAYAGLAILNRNMGRLEDAARYFELALKRLDGMTERERYRTLGAYHLFKREPDQAIQELEALINKFPGDTGAHSNVALAHFYRRDMRKSLEFSQRALNMYPTNVVYRTNRALYAMYASDFEIARNEANTTLTSNPGYPKALLVLAVSAVMNAEQGDAKRFYTEMGGRNASLATIGLGDAALFEGRADDALGILNQSLVKESDGSMLGRKLTAVAQAHTQLGNTREAIRAAAAAVDKSSEPAVLMEAAEMYVELRRPAEATALARRLADRLDPDSRAHAMVIEAELQRIAGQPGAAITKLRDAQKIADTWSGRLALGRAYFDAGAWTEAYSSLQSCLTRRGEGAARFLDDVPTTRVVPPVHYYLGLVQEKLGTAGAAESFRTFLRLRHAANDKLTADARARLARFTN